MARNKEDKRSFIQKLRHKYRLLILNEDSYEEVGFVRLSRLNLLAIGGLVAVLVVAIVYVIIAYTPVREFIPGYPDAIMSHNIRQNAMKLDSLEREIALRDQYFVNINRLVNGERPEDYLNDTTTSGGRNAIIFNSSINDSILRQQVEAEEQFRLSVDDQRDITGSNIHNVHFFTPVDGYISNEFAPQIKHFGIDLVAGPNEEVKATLDGTVTLADWTLKTGYVLQIQHENNIISLYKHNAELFKDVGQKVKAGDVIAIVGNSGELTSGPHLHFELWHNGVPLDPTEYVVF